MCEAETKGRQGDQNLAGSTRPKLSADINMTKTDVTRSQILVKDIHTKP